MKDGMDSQVEEAIFKTLMELSVSSKNWQLRITLRFC